MKTKLIVLMTSVMITSQMVNATNAINSSLDRQASSNNDNNAKQSPNFLQQITPEFLYSYIDFDFDSTTGLNFNRYQGHSNLYSVGGDNVQFIPSVTGGIYVFRVNTEVNSQFLALPFPLTKSYQSIDNNTLFGHLRKSFKSQSQSKFDVDLAAGYGQNKINSTTWIGLDTANPVLGLSNHDNSNWFTSLNGIYRKQGKKINFKAFAGLLYSQIHSGSYFLFFQPVQPVQVVTPLTNKTTYVMEGAEVGYKLNSKLTPFINGGLIQVANISNSRPLFAAPINGSLPQLNMDKNGFKLGGGFTFKQKQFTVRLEERYYQAGRIFASYQTVAGLEYRFS
ncbi:hypothetical protein EP47_11805 [Legionella norrlandica]|uniref:Autotransporter domain-containing protein n=1 Tax=Legionella norrlandica TaxID=1498499 RepID=A0A0A2SUL9_9GAMM|nr:autotransporter outer membrane beta-barrel domain-containing protein [Legionella norrlandica]KGP64442.1 hypothetical protein EP47_11805 [Legionella norrlandica]